MKLDAVVLPLVVALTAIALPSVWAKEGETVYNLTLTNASPGKGDVQIFLQGGRGVALGWNSTGHAVDAGGLTIKDGVVSGDLTVLYRFDGFLPGDGKETGVTYRLTGAVAGDKVNGTFACDATNGVLQGTVSSAPTLDGYRLLVLTLENGAGSKQLNKGSWGNRASARIILKDGKPVQSCTYGHGGRAQVNYFESEVATNALVLSPGEGRLTGSLAVRPTETNESYVWSFDGAVAGDRLSGTFKKTVDGVALPGGPFRGELSPFPDQPLGQAVYFLELQGALPNGGQLMAFIPRISGGFGTGMGYAPHYNKTYHEVDGSNLTVVGEQVTGTVAVTFMPDPYVPPDRKPAPGLYAVQARAVDGRYLTGTFTGRFRDAPVQGALRGELSEQPVVPDPVAINLKLDDGVNDGAPWLRRVYVGFTAVSGKAEKGGISNNKGGWKGTFQSAEVKFDGPKFTASISGTVDTSNGPKTGAYVFKLTGRVVGKELFGTVETFRDGQRTKAGTPFMGSFEPGTKR